MSGSVYLVFQSVSVAQSDSLIDGKLCGFGAEGGADFS